MLAECVKVESILRSALILQSLSNMGFPEKQIMEKLENFLAPVIYQVCLSSAVLAQRSTNIFIFPTFFFTKQACYNTVVYLL